MIRKGFLYALPPITLILALSIWGWIGVGDATQIPVHFGMDGAPDRMGGKLEGFVLLPALALALCGLFALMPLIDPRGDNLRRSAPAVLTAWAGVLWVLAAAQALITLTALDHLQTLENPGVLVGFASMVLLAVLSNVLSKTRPNWLVGIRTPWTLSSDKSWDVTHRWGGRLMTLGGSISAACFLFAPTKVAFAVLGVTVCVIVAVSLGLSYWVWKTDPDREVYSAASD
ncbi:SdpI family protein [Oceanicaulis alexandrii]|uniref:SdpI family protein n=1 Tax=Oceanicaulis alexandrii TaxID=153233 RepID=UPI00235464F8|nr:SdpI family protein [Oceanicaulis alexandrii]